MTIKVVMIWKAWKKPHCEVVVFSSLSSSDDFAFVIPENVVVISAFLAGQFTPWKAPLSCWVAKIKTYFYNKLYIQTSSYILNCFLAIFIQIYGWKKQWKMRVHIVVTFLSMNHLQSGKPENIYLNVAIGTSASLS